MILPRWETGYKYGKKEKMNWGWILEQTLTKGTAKYGDLAQAV